MTSSTPKAPTELPSFAGPDLNTKKPKFKLPPGAADCHVHVLGPREKYQYSPERLYTPPDVFLQDYINMLDALECDRAVLVQSGIHGVHNEVIVDALAQYPDRLRGIALINERITDAELDKLAAAGVRGFRANLHHKIGVQFDAAKRLAARVKRLGWHVQFLLDIEDFPDIDRVLGDYPVEVVIDHLGRPDTRRGTGAPGFQALLRLLQGGRAWAKLSGPYRKSAGGFPYADLDPFAHALVATAPDRLVWGTDWPHVMLDSPMPNDGDLCDLLAVWVPDAQVRSQILVDNPQRLYGF